MGLVRAIEKQTQIKASVRKVKDKLFTVQYSCQRGMKLARWLYSNGGLKMNRKYAQYTKAVMAKGGGQL